MSSDEEFNDRPTNDPSVKDLVHYLLQREITGMCKLGSYSGIIKYQLIAKNLSLCAALFPISACSAMTIFRQSYDHHK